MSDLSQIRALSYRTAGLRLLMKDFSRQRETGKVVSRWNLIPSRPNFDHRRQMMKSQSCFLCRCPGLECSVEAVNGYPCWLSAQALTPSKDTRNRSLDWLPNRENDRDHLYKHPCRDPPDLRSGRF